MKSVEKIKRQSDEDDEDGKPEHKPRFATLPPLTRILLPGGDGGGAALVVIALRKSFHQIQEESHVRILPVA